MTVFLTFGSPPATKRIKIGELRTQPRPWKRPDWRGVPV